jgi:hypothetical protein
VEKVVPWAGKAVETVGWISEVNTTGEALKTGNPGFPRIFLRLLLQTRPTEKHKGIESKKQ